VTPTDPLPPALAGPRGALADPLLAAPTDPLRPAPAGPPGAAPADPPRAAPTGPLGAALTGPLEAAPTESLLAGLVDAVRPLGSVVVAFSGGVDSSLVAAVAAQALGQRALAVTAVSPAVAEGELDGARRVARAIGIAHETIATVELAREGYRRNAPDRCYFCKTELYESLAALAEQRGYAALLSGANADDAGDWRPGLRAAAEHEVRHPLLEAGAGKAAVRALARELGLPSAEKPATPCLASRIPYGTAVDPATLQLIDRAERAVRALGFAIVRVRHHGILGRVEIAAEDLHRALAREPELVGAVRAAGYRHAVLDREPFRSGRLNDALGVISGP
jgi:pyridinium-3,5-biscarboxylic acid mononucleotide sulfurtransferase